MSVRRPHRRERLGRLSGPTPERKQLALCRAGLAGSGRWERLRAALVLVCALAGMGTAGVISCAGSSEGFYHEVRQGENLYRIGLRYGVEARTIARVNRIRDVTELQVGQKLWIPRGRRGKPNERNGATRNVAHHSGPSRAEARRAAREEALRGSQLSFAWPLSRSKLTSRFGMRNGRPHEGIDLGTRKGTPIKAAEAGRVIHSGWLGDYGRVVIVKHTGHFRSVYAHANKLHVKKGQFVDRGQKIAEVGTSGNASGPHLHFEIRRREEPEDPMVYLP